jgi:integral membrane sensor domain MASE1
MNASDTLGLSFGALVVLLLTVGFSIKAARTKGPQMAWWFGGGISFLLGYRLLGKVWPAATGWLDQGLNWMSEPPIPRPEWLTPQVLGLVWTVAAILGVLAVVKLFVPGLKLSTGGGGGKSKR